MKTKMITLFAVAILLTSTSFATKNEEPSLQIQNAFNGMFVNTTQVEWTSVSNLYQVTFMQAGQYLTAYYNVSGEFISLSRNITISMLPLILHGKLQDKLSNAWVSNCFELYRENGTEYYVTLENSNEKTIYRSNNTDWSTYKMIQK